MENKQILVATFISKDKLEWLIKYLDKKFSIKKNCVFIYEVEDNEIEYLITFKLIKDKRIDLKFHFVNATIVNIKSGCIFSINGLNRLIESKSGCDIGNISYDKYEINWIEYKNKLILSNKNKLILKNIKKIEI